jgi:hypothetical protein
MHLELCRQDPVEGVCLLPCAAPKQRSDLMNSPTTKQWIDPVLLHHAS